MLMLSHPLTDDLSLLQLVCLSGLLVQYNFQEHVASDIEVGQEFLPPSNYNSQNIINQIE